LFATIAGEISFTDLTPASGRQDHTASPSARDVIRLLTSFASTASRPASVTIASRPSVGRDGGDMQVIWIKWEQEYFCEQDWTTQITLESLRKSSFLWNWKFGRSSRSHRHAYRTDDLRGHFRDAIQTGVLDAA
jgi:hypothetical protein